MILTASKCLNNHLVNFPINIDTCTIIMEISIVHFKGSQLDFSTLSYCCS